MSEKKPENAAATATALANELLEMLPQASDVSRWFGAKGIGRAPGGKLHHTPPPHTVLKEAAPPTLPPGDGLRLPEIANPAVERDIRAWLETLNHGDLAGRIKRFGEAIRAASEERDPGVPRVQFPPSAAALIAHLPNVYSSNWYHAPGEPKANPAALQRSLSDLLHKLSAMTASAPAKKV